MDQATDQAPLETVTFQPTIDDQVAVTSLQAMGITRQQWVLIVFYLLVFVVISAYFLSRWWRMGYTEPVEVLTLVVIATFVTIVLTYARRKHAVRQAVQRHYDNSKNIGLLVPSTLSLHEDYVAERSTLSAGYHRWVVIEQVLHRGGYLMMKTGGLALYVPDRAFDSPEAAARFRATAERLFEASRTSDPDLRAAAPWETGD